MRRVRSMALAAVAYAALAGCASQSQAAGGTIDITGSSFSYDPPTLVFDPGQEVHIRLIVEDSPHDLVLEGHDLELAGEAGDVVEGTFEVGESGTYAYYCTLPGHRSAGMVGQLTVP